MSLMPQVFDSQVRWLKRGIPIPLGVVCNKNLFVALKNLIDLIMRCTVNSVTANQTVLFLIMKIF